MISEEDPSKVKGWWLVPDPWSLVHGFGVLDSWSLYLCPLGSWSLAEMTMETESKDPLRGAGPDHKVNLNHSKKLRDGIKLALQLDVATEKSMLESGMCLEMAPCLFR